MDELFSERVSMYYCDGGARIQTALGDEACQVDRE